MDECSPCIVTMLTVLLPVVGLLVVFGAPQHLALIRVVRVLETD